MTCNERNNDLDIMLLLPGYVDKASLLLHTFPLQRVHLQIQGFPT